jgi:hypothetical protein
VSCTTTASKHLTYAAFDFAGSKTAMRMQVELIVLGVVLLMLPAALATNPTAS